MLIGPLSLSRKQNYTYVRTGERPEEKNHRHYYKISPQTALNRNFDTTYRALENIIGKKLVYEIFNGKEIKGPHAGEANSEWFGQSKIIGINPRAIGSYFDIVKYAMTFPEDSIHIMPLFEQGYQSSLYAPINFQLSEEFMDEKLKKLGFDTPEKQLKLTVNLLHALNKNVGMDFLEHTDRFSEEVFINPDFFSWAKIAPIKERELIYPEINPDKIGDFIKEAVIEFLRINGDDKGEKIPEIILKNLYSFKEDKIREIIFSNGNLKTRTKRRVALMEHIRSLGYETRPISHYSLKKKVDFKKMMQANGKTWAIFSDNGGGTDEDCQFGNLAGFKLYHLDKNANPDITRPNIEAWEYICKQYANFQSEYGFDFLRADMGYLHYGDSLRDIHSLIKEYIKQNGTKHFATMGECFSLLGYGEDEAIRRKNYDSVLGNLHYENVYNPQFCSIIRAYNFNPNYKVCLTSITADSDQTKYNENYDNFQNTIRLFLGLFSNQPSYMGMGLETRDTNPTEGKNLTKDFINNWGVKNYEWGKICNFLPLFQK